MHAEIVTGFYPVLKDVYLLIDVFGFFCIGIFTKFLVNVIFKLSVIDEELFVTILLNLNLSSQSIVTWPFCYLSNARPLEATP